MNTTLELIDAISKGNAVETEAAFNAAMAEKISARLDDMKAGVAQSMFNPQAVEDQEDQQEEQQTEEQ